MISLRSSLFVEIWRLIEEILDAWLKLLGKLCELESPACNMEVQSFVLIFVIR